MDRLPASFAARSAAIVTLIALTGVSAADAADVTLTLSHWSSPTGSVHEGLTKWAEDLKDDSGGRLEVKIFPAGQMGAAKDHFDMARDGIVDIAWPSPGFTPGRFPMASAIEVPFLVKDSNTGAQAFDEWYRPYAEKEMSEVHYCLAILSPPGYLNFKGEPVVDPAGMAGRKIRPANPTLGRFATALGATAVAIPAPEAPQAMLSGLIDSITFPLSSLRDYGLHSSATYHLEMPIYVTPTAIVINKGKYKSLPHDLRLVIDNHCNSEWAGIVSDVWQQAEREASEELRRDPVQNFYPVTEEQRNAWLAAAQPFAEEWMQAVTRGDIVGEEAYAALLTLLEKLGAKL